MKKPAAALTILLSFFLLFVCPDITCAQGKITVTSGRETAGSPDDRSADESEDSLVIGGSASDTKNGLAALTYSESCIYFMEDFSGLSANTWSSGYGYWYFQYEKMNVEQIPSGKMGSVETAFYPDDYFTLDVDVERVSLPEGGAYGIYPFTSGDVFFGVDGKTLAGVGVLIFDSGNAYLTGWDVLENTWYKSDKYPATSPVTSVGVAYSADAVTLRINRQDTPMKFSGDFSFSYGIVDKLWLIAQGEGTQMRFDNVCSDPATTPPSATYTLSVSKSGAGSGTVTSSPSGINCGIDCAEDYDEGAAVTLAASADTGSVFSGWSGGGCSGTGTCTVILNADTAVTAAFGKMTTVLQPPQNLRYTLNGSMLAIDWDAVSGAAGYKISLGMQSGNYGSPGDIGNITGIGPVDISGVPAGTYYIAVKAYNGAQESGYSNEIAVTYNPAPAALQAPQNLRYTLNGGMLAIDWDAVSGAAGYKISLGMQSGNYGSPGDVGNITGIGPVDISGVPAGTYYIAVKAYNGTQESGYSNEIAIHLTSADIYAPGPVVPGTTTPESANIVTTPGQKTTLGLSDGTSVDLPPLSQPVSVTIGRESNAVDLSQYGMETSGSMRVLTVSYDTQPEGLVPRITIPAGEAGNINGDTINIVRIADMVIDDTAVRDRISFLSAQRDANGNIVVSDPYMPNTMMAATSSGSKYVGEYEGAKAGAALKPLTIKYAVSTFQGNLNWTRPPLLVRMAPDKSHALKRRPFSQLSAAEQEKEQNKCAQNIIVLVHGHNEAEKAGVAGTFTPDVDGPWFFKYKRDVWTHLYDEFLNDQSAPAGCTVFYEFIYPSWRPIFTHLGKELSDMLSQELKPLITKNDPKVNLFIVAHSMGGLVARSAIQNFDQEMHDAFQKLVTWGSPHHGGALVTVEYALTADPAYSVGGEDKPGLGIPLQNIDLVRSFVSGMAIDTPGNRDLRWDNSRPLRLDDWFSMDAQQNPDAGLWAKYDLVNGTWLYNENLRKLNTNDVYNYLSAPVNRLTRNKYVFLYGITSKKATTSGSLKWGTYQFATSSPIAQGAFLTSVFMKNPDDLYEGVPISSSDGAVPVSSMAAEGIAGYRASLGDVDHEEYFGAPTDPGVFTASDKAISTAAATLSWLEIKDKVYACPEAKYNYASIGFSGYLTYSNGWKIFSGHNCEMPYHARDGVWGKLKWSGQNSFSGDDTYSVQDPDGTIFYKRCTMSGTIERSPDTDEPLRIVQASANCEEHSRFKRYGNDYWEDTKTTTRVTVNNVPFETYNYGFTSDTALFQVRRTDASASLGSWEFSLASKSEKDDGTILVTENYSLTSVDMEPCRNDDPSSTGCSVGVFFENKP